jgi:hypothetical protein
MSVVRRCSAGAVVAGLVLLGGPAWAQEADPCAPGPDGSVPEMCQSGPAPGADPATPTVGMEPEDPCAGSRPVEPGDGVVTDEGDQGIGVGEPAPGAEPDVLDDPEGQKDPERVDPEETDPTVVDDAARGDQAPGAVGEDGIVCAFGVPVSAPGGAESSAGGVTAVSQLPRTGPHDRLLALTAFGGALVVVGAGAAAAGRRRTGQVQRV